MQNFEYIAPTETMAATQALSPHAGVTAVLAGGTDLLSLMKQRVETPSRVVSLRNIPSLRGISKKGGGLRIGAMATVQELLDSRAAAGYKSLLDAARGITAPQVRAMGTVAGDLLQRPRCWYLPQRARLVRHARRKAARSRRREPLPRDPRQQGGPRTS